jgi:hypothetical protein
MMPRDLVQTVAQIFGIGNKAVQMQGERQIERASP